MLSLFLILVGGVVGISIWSCFIEPRWFRLRRQTVRLAKPLSRPLTILHLSDLHFTRSYFWLGRFFDRLAPLEPDFVFVTGDLIDSRSGIEPLLANLKKLRPRFGTYAVLGNHDYWIYPAFDTLIWTLSGRTWSRTRPEVGDLERRLLESGIRLLKNENESVRLTDKEEAVIIGIDDPVTGQADVERSFRGIENGVVHLALSHSPKVFPSLKPYSPDVVFSGHTHGGQIRIPGYGAPPPVRRIEPVIDSTNQFGFVGIVSRGLGAAPWVRFRFFCRPEAGLVHIEPASKD